MRGGESRARKHASLADMRPDDDADGALADFAHEFERAQQPTHLRDAEIDDAALGKAGDVLELRGPKHAFVQDDFRLERLCNAPLPFVVTGPQRLLKCEERK